MNEWISYKVCSNQNAWCSSMLLKQRIILIFGSLCVKQNIGQSFSEISLVNVPNSLRFYRRTLTLSFKSSQRKDSRLSYLLILVVGKLTLAWWRKITRYVVTSGIILFEHKKFDVSSRYQTTIPVTACAWLLQFCFVMNSESLTAGPNQKYSTRYILIKGFNF